ncbi:MAG: hypothetical protein ACRYG2_24295 [Janthinobacterium lividum]
MSSSVAAGLVLLVVALSVGSHLLNLPTPLNTVLQFVLILVAVLIGSKIKKKSNSDQG